MCMKRKHLSPHKGLNSIDPTKNNSVHFVANKNATQALYQSITITSVFFNVCLSR